MTLYDQSKGPIGPGSGFGGLGCPLTSIPCGY